MTDRFIKFYDVSADRSQGLATMVFNILNEYNFMDKLICQCYDAAAVMSSSCNELQS